MLRQGEDAGRYRRGYFVEGLGAAQFGLTGAIDRLRALAAEAERGSAGRPTALVLAATDPANPYGAALAWPERVRPARAAEAGKRGHQPARKAGALVVLVDGACVLYVERGGKTLLSFTDEADCWRQRPARWRPARAAGALGKLHVSRPTASRSRPPPLGDGAGSRPASGRPRAACGCGAEPGA